MITQKEYSVFKIFLNKHKNNLSIEYILDILLLIKPKGTIKYNPTKTDIKNIGFILIKIEKLLNNIPEIQNTYIHKETIKLFKLIWLEN
jgi:hypothetical protein